ncbi:Zinc finger MYM-type protein 4 [Merluccius polli]|uniref:Zinc finger MYM-type protein 4 n=1 Tax=Merluccius polli TaxID=89951 RepID=A0AA47NTE1_MERPO|nr:Zinc finger MYM-type protein 4 [Merluccius polli]
MEEADDHRLQTATPPRLRSPAEDPPSPSLVTVKDEPMDKEYNQTLLSPSSTPTDEIKNEPDAPKELMISSVFSMAGMSSSALRPTPSLAKDIPLPADPRSNSNLYMMCSLCKKTLIKGQTAYQKKGSPLLFCSPICLSFKPQGPATKICHHCHKSMLRLQDLILAPIDSGSLREFCSANCLTGFNKAQAERALKAKNTAPVLKTCSMCKKTVRTSNKHEVEDFASKSLMLMNTTGENKSLCSDACLTTFKKQSTTSHACSMCATVTLLSDTVHTTNSLGMVEIFCTTGCLQAQSISSSGNFQWALLTGWPSWL